MHSTPRSLPGGMLAAAASLRSRSAMAQANEKLKLATFRCSRISGPAANIMLVIQDLPKQTRTWTLSTQASAPDIAIRIDKAASASRLLPAIQKKRSL